MANTQKYLNHLLQTVGITPACSEEEREAADEIARIFSNHGFDPEIQEFTSSASPKTMRAILCCVMFVAAILMGIGGLIGVVGTILVVASGILFVLERFGRISFPQVGAGGLSQNVIAYHKASGPLASPRNRPVVVIAHYDSPRGDILASGPLAAYRPLLVKLLPFTMAAPVIIAVVRLLPLPEPAKIALWVAAIVVSLIPLLNGVALILNRFALPYTSGSVCNKSSVAAMLGVMDAVSPFAGRDEFPGDLPFDEYMEEQRSMYAVDEYDEGVVPPIPTGEHVEDEYAAEDETLIEQPIEQLSQESAGYEDEFDDEPTDAFESDYDEIPLEGDTVVMPAIDTAGRIEVESAADAAVSDDEAPVVNVEPAADEPEPEESGLPINDAGCIRFGVDTLRSLGMVASSCAIEYEEGALPAVAPIADKVVFEPAVEQVPAEPVRSVVDVPSPEKPVQEEPRAERPIETPVAPVVVPPVAPEVIPIVTAPADQMDDEAEVSQHEEEPIDEVAVTADETVAFAAQTDDVFADQDDSDVDIVDPFADVPDMEREPIDDQIDWAYHEDAEVEEDVELEELDDIEDVDGAIEAEFELLDDDQLTDEAGYDLEGGFVSDEDAMEPVDEGAIADDEVEVLGTPDAMEGVVEDIDVFESESDAVEVEPEETEDGQSEAESVDDETAFEDDAYIDDEVSDAVEGFVEGDEEFEVEQDEGVDAVEFDGDAVEDDDFYEGATQQFQPIADEELGERIETETLVYDQLESDGLESPETEDVNEAYDEAEYVDEAELVGETDEEFEVEPDIMEALYEVIDDEDPVDADDEGEFTEGEDVQFDATTEFAAAEEPVDEDSIDAESDEDEADDVCVAKDDLVDEQTVADEDEFVDEPVIDGDETVGDLEPEAVLDSERDEPEHDEIDRSVPLGGATQTFDVSTLIQGTQPFVEQPLDATLPRTQETVDSLMDQISTEPAARPRRSLNIPDISSTSPYIPRTVPPNVPEIDPAPRTIASAVQQQKSGSIANRSTLFDLPDPSVSASDPLANVGATGGMRMTSGSTSQFTVIGPNDVVPPSAPASGTFETISAPAPQSKKKKRGLGGLFGRKKKREESSMSDWLGVDEDFDAKRSGRDIGSWDNFEGDDGWKGGATGDASLTEAELREAITSMGDDELLGHDIWFVATGSSEHANAGARAFLESHRDKLRGVFLINLECVGSGMLAMLATEGERRVLKGDKRIMGLVSRVSSDFHHEIASVDMPFVDTDAHAAMEMSLRALTIAGVDGVNFACSHGAEDIPVNIDAANVELTAEVVTEVIRRS
ncbi:M28 family peptidase [Collinsella tanakaei]|uniref:M28 family peptidase n=1 Tax=Collinsella tanakaei TaxID=626935 RepID=UPI0025A461D6|nr:M28 family peptidase [Collinsella tanakaei]MDM8302310.1 M28 family peptidase [Collinsella tanakaei]